MNTVLKIVRMCSDDSVLAPPGLQCSPLYSLNSICMPLLFSLIIKIKIQKWSVTVQQRSLFDVDHKPSRHKTSSSSPKSQKPSIWNNITKNLTLNRGRLYLLNLQMKSFFHHILNNSDIVLTSEIRVKMNTFTHVHFLWNSKSGAAGRTKSEF